MDEKLADDAGSATRLRSFRFGLILFTGALALSLIGMFGFWWASTAADYAQAYQSWNCQVTRETGAIFGWYCMPDGIRFFALATTCFAYCLALLLINRILVMNWFDGAIWAQTSIRLAIAVLVVGAVIFIEFYFSEYVLEYRGKPVLIGVALAAAVASKSVFPRLNPLLLTIPLVIAGIFGFALTATVLGIVFDV